MHLHNERFLDIGIPFLNLAQQNEIGKKIEYIFNLKSKADILLEEEKEKFLKEELLK